MNAIRVHVRAVDVFLIAAIGLSVALWIEASALKPPFDIYPKMVILLVGLLSIICLIQNMVGDGSAGKLERGSGFWSFLITVGGIFVYVIAIDVVGYFSSTLVYLCLFFLIKRWSIDGRAGIRPKGIAVDIALASIVTAVVGLVFKFGLKLVFPEALFI